MRALLAVYAAFVLALGSLCGSAVAAEAISDQAVNIAIYPWTSNVSYPEFFLKVLNSTRSEITSADPLFVIKENTSGSSSGLWTKSGTFGSREPDMEAIRRKARESGDNAVIMYSFQMDPNGGGQGWPTVARTDIFLIDIESGSVYKKQFTPGTESALISHSGPSDAIAGLARRLVLENRSKLTRSSAPAVETAMETPAKAAGQQMQATTPPAAKPSGSRQESQVASTNTSPSGAKSSPPASKQEIPAGGNASKAGGETAVKESQAAFIHHKAYPGETLGTIAKWYSGNEDRWQEIADQNPGLHLFELTGKELIRVPVSMAVAHSKQANHSTAPRQAPPKKTAEQKSLPVAKTPKPAANPPKQEAKPAPREDAPLEAVFGPK